MPYLNLDLDYPDHDKTMALMGLLGPDADAIPMRLWCYCGKYHSDSGTIPPPAAAATIERRVRWRGQAGKCVEALVSAGFLDALEDGGYQVHDWLEHCGHLAVFKKRATAAAHARWAKAREPPADATSNAQTCASNACSNAPTTPSEPTKPNLLFRENGEEVLGNCPETLGGSWCWHSARKKNRGRPADDMDDAETFLVELSRELGWTKARMLAEIARKGRGKTETLGEFKFRLKNEPGSAEPEAPADETEQQRSARIAESNRQAKIKAGVL